MNGESLHGPGRLPGHRRASTTNRYVRLDDATLSHDAGRPALTVESKLRAAGARAERGRQGSLDNMPVPELPEFPE